MIRPVCNSYHSGDGELDAQDPNDPVAMYLREAASSEQLTAAEEAELFRRLSASDDWRGETEDAAQG